MKDENLFFENYIRVKQAAGIFQVHDKTIYRWIKQGVLPAKKINRTLVLSISDIERLMEDK